MKTSPKPPSPKTTDLTDSFLAEVLLTLNLERALIFVNEVDGWKPSSSHEIPLEDFWKVAPLSFTVLENALEIRDALLFVDAAGAEQEVSISAVLTGLRSVVCVPVYPRGDSSGEAIAMIYADNRIEKGAFSESDAETLKELAQELSERLGV